jgi:hypothetical protein
MLADELSGHMKWMELSGTDLEEQLPRRGIDLCWSGSGHFHRGSVVCR